MQYIGQEHFHSNKKIFSLEDGPQQRVIGIDDALIWMGIIYVVAATAAVYSANVPDTSNLTLTMPKVRGYEYGSWAHEDQFRWHKEVVFEGKTYGINEQTGEIKDVDSNEDLSYVHIPEEVRDDAAGITTRSLANALAKEGVHADNDYEWYTFGDLVSDELEGGHTIERHIMKSNNYLLNRVRQSNSGNVFVSTYTDVFLTLLAINEARLENLPNFNNVSKKYEFDTVLSNCGRGVGKDEKFINHLNMTRTVINPSNSEKGYRVLTSFPKIK